MQIPNHLEDFITGLFAGAASETIIDIPLSKAGLYYTVRLVEKGGAYIWGFGSGDVVNAVIGLLISMGYIPDVPREVGYGWLAVLGVEKIMELRTALVRWSGGLIRKGWDIVV